MRKNFEAKAGKAKRNCKQKAVEHGPGLNPTGLSGDAHGRILDCSSSVINPLSTRACPSSLIFAACRAFISATTGFLFFSCNEPSRDRPVVKPAPNSSVVLLNLEWPLEAIPCLENFGTATRAAHRSYFWTRGAIFGLGTRTNHPSPI
jgi:hypothetical protein